LEKRFRVKDEKTSLLTVFKHKNKKIVIANSHLVCYAPNSRRINQITKIIKKVKTLGDDSAFSTVILGDFNYTSRIRQKKLIEFMEKTTWQMPTKPILTNISLFLSSWIMFSLIIVLFKNVKIGKTIKFSDHSPVTFDIEFCQITLLQFIAIAASVKCSDESLFY
jgi:exonuclease III